MNALRHALVWCVIVPTVAAVALWAQGAALTASLTGHWQRQLQATHGLESSERIKTRAVRLAHALESRASQVVRSPDATAANAALWSPERRQAMVLMLVKTTTAIAWWPALLPLWFAAAVQGWVWRDILRYRFPGSDPRVHGACSALAIATAGVTATALVLPIDLPLTAIPIAGALFAALMASAIAHYPAWQG